jgi:hypothetical protein
MPKEFVNTHKMGIRYTTVDKGEQFLVVLERKCSNFFVAAYV